MDEEQHRHLKSLRGTHLRRLHVLEEQAATQGINVAAEILLEIDDLRKKITDIEEQLTTGSWASLSEDEKAEVTPKNETRSIPIALLPGSSLEKRDDGTHLLTYVKNSLYIIGATFIVILVFFVISQIVLILINSFINATFDRLSSERDKSGYYFLLSLLEGLRILSGVGIGTYFLVSVIINLEVQRKKINSKKDIIKNERF